jgi:hypothetical protein
MKLKSFLVFLTILSCTTSTDITNELEQSTTSISSTSSTIISPVDSTTTTNKSNLSIEYGQITCRKISSTGISISIEIENPKDKAYSAYFQVLDDSKYLSESYNAGINNYIDFIIRANSKDKFEFKYIHKNIQQPEDLTNQKLIDEYGITVLLFVNDKQINRECEYKLDFITKDTTTSTTSTTLPNRTRYFQSSLNAYKESFNFSDGSGSYNSYLRWSGPIVTISISGNPSPIQRDTFNYVVGDLNRLIQDVEFKIVEKQGNINYFFGNKQSWKDNNNSCNDSTENRMSYGWKSKSGNFSTAYFCGINQDEYTSYLTSASEKAAEECAIYDIRSTLSYLVTSSLRNASWEKYGEGIFSRRYCNKGTSYTSIDEDIIKIHYDSRVKNSDFIEDVFKKLSDFTTTDTSTTSTTSTTTTTTIPNSPSTTDNSQNNGSIDEKVNSWTGSIGGLYIDLSINPFDSDEWTGTIGNDFVSLSKNPFDSDEWTGTIGNDFVSLSKNPFDSDEWTGTIGNDFVSLSKNPFDSDEWNANIGNSSASFNKNYFSGLWEGYGPAKSAILLIIILNS